MSEKVVVINDHELVLTNLDKILFPKAKITKLDLINYYIKMGAHMLPFMQNRALSLLRYPDGVLGQIFFQKNTPDYFPKWIKRVRVSLKTIDQFDDYMICNNLESLVYLANYVCVPHAWLSLYDKLDYPNKIIFDLDPANTQDFNQVRLLSLELNSLLTRLGLKSWAMLTGSTGMHVVVPIKRNKPFNDVRMFAKDVASLLVKQNPNLYTLELNIAKRQDRIFIDTHRNSFGATAVVPYAVRDKEGAPIAMPISWQEVQDPMLDSQRYHLKNIDHYLAQELSPWPDYDQGLSTLAEPIKKLNKLMK